MNQAIPFIVAGFTVLIGLCQVLFLFILNDINKKIGKSFRAAEKAQKDIQDHISDHAKGLFKNAPIHSIPSL